MSDADDARPRQKTGPKPRGGKTAGRMLRVRLNDDEWLELEIRRREAGCRNLSEYARLRMLGRR